MNDSHTDQKRKDKKKKKKTQQDHHWTCQCELTGSLMATGN